MNTVRWIAIIILAVLSAVAPRNFGGNATAQSAGVLQPGDPGYKIPSGVTLLAELTETLDSKKAAVGDEVRAKLELEMRYEGKVMIPVDSKIAGHVRTVRPSAKDNPESEMQVVFDKVILKDGREMPFEYPALIAAIAPEKRAAMAKSNLSDLPVKPELGTAVDRNSASPGIQGGKSSLTMGMLNETARGVVGLKGIELVEGPKGTVLAARKGNVKLDYGTQMLLIVATPAQK